MQPNPMTHRAARHHQPAADAYTCAAPYADCHGAATGALADAAISGASGPSGADTSGVPGEAGGDYEISNKSNCNKIYVFFSLTRCESLFFYAFYYAKIIEKL